MNLDQLTELLKNYRSYKYAANNCGEPTFRMPAVYSERQGRLHPDLWDQSRYHRIVNLIEGAVNEVLSDNQRMVVAKKYFDRNGMTLNQIADYERRDRSTISRWHTEALRQLAIALQPLSEDEKEISNFDHMFTPGWVFNETA
jgi:hypothetical protein